MIHHSVNRPPQYGFYHLGRGWYVSVDPVGGLITLLEWVLQVIPGQWIPLYRNRHGYRRELWSRGDYLYRVRLGVQHWVYRRENTKYAL